MTTAGQGYHKSHPAVLKHGHGAFVARLLISSPRFSPTMRRLAPFLFVWAAFAVMLPQQSQADIFRWDNMQVIAGTQGITPGPGVQLVEMDLSFADLKAIDLTGASFERGVLNSATFDQSTLADADFTDAEITGLNLNRATEKGFIDLQLYTTKSWQEGMLQGVKFTNNDLTFWDFSVSDLTGADFSGSLVADASFFSSTLTKEQLYSTKSYLDKLLEGIDLGTQDLTGWDFSGQDLQRALFDSADFTNANLSNTNLRLANLADATVTGANFTGARVNGALLAGVALTKEQFYATQSYLTKDLSEVALLENDLTGWDFSAQNLSRADLSYTMMGGVNLTGAVVTGAILRGTVAGGLTKEQFYSTASYLQKSLGAVDLSDNDLGGWDFSGQDLTDARFEFALLAGTDFTGATIAGARFSDTTDGGFTKEQLYTTASYQAKNLHGIMLRSNVLDGWDFRGQDLRESDFIGANTAGADFSLADMRLAVGFNAQPTTIMRNTIDPDSLVIDLNLLDGETLVARGQEELPVSIFGEFSIAPTGKLDLENNTAIVWEAPASAVRAQVIAGRASTGIGAAWNGNGITSSTVATANAAEPDSRSIGYSLNSSLPLGPYDEFHLVPVEPDSVLIAVTRTGDANLDGVVNDDDVTIVGATYAPGVPNPNWAMGDFDYNGFVDDDDVTLLGALYDPDAPPVPVPPAGGATEPLSVVAVPEPSAFVLALIAALALCQAGRRRVLANGNPSGSTI